MKCFNCQHEAVDLHHVIFRNKIQGGTNHKFNLVPLCRKCHNMIHHSFNTMESDELKSKLYDYIRPNLKYCWAGKVKGKIVRLIESGEL